ncbi:MAG: DOMON domain-containing protein [Bacillota bacterium]|nr:DOMON domain-containing protein [Bacillota bacterium]
MKYLLMAVILVGILLVAGCGGVAEAPESPEPTGIPDGETGIGEIEGPMMGKIDQAITVQGSSEGYPAEPLQVAGAQIYLAHDDNYLYVYMEAEVEGWIAVGFNTRGVMSGANMILGYMDGTNPEFRDDIGQARSHSEAGTTAVDQFYLARVDGKTIMEFSYPLAFPEGQGYNVEELIPGESYALIVATHRNSDNITTMHTTRGTTTFVVQP